MFSYNDATTDATSGENCNTSVYICGGEEKPWEDDSYNLWLLVELRERREYLKSMWLKALKLKEYFIFGQCWGCKLYFRRLLISISGWLARKGYAKKN